MINYNFTGYKPPTWFEQILTFFSKFFKGSTSTSTIQIASTVPYPTSYITDISAIAVAMQAQEPDCVENGVTFAKMYYDYKKNGIVPNLSPRFLFNISTPSENGTSLAIALEKARKIGICENQYLVNDTTLPYNEFVVMPSTEAYTNAQTHLISAYMCNANPQSYDLKSLIKQFGIVLIGIEINQNWWLPSWSPTDILPIKPPNGQNDPTLSRHCVALYGYDENYYYFRNWWSNAWAKSGNGFFGVDDLPYIYEIAVISDQ